MKERYLVSTQDPSSFATLFRDTLAAVTKLAADQELDDTTRSLLDYFFPDCSIEQSRARVARYRRMTHGQQAEDEITGRWSLDNLVYSMQETKDEWTFVDIETVDRTMVAVVVDTWEPEFGIFVTDGCG